MVGLNQVDPPVHGLQVIFDDLVPAYGVREDFDSRLMAAVDHILRKNVPLRIDRVRFQAGG